MWVIREGGDITVRVGSSPESELSMDHYKQMEQEVDEFIGEVFSSDIDTGVKESDGADLAAGDMTVRLGSDISDLDVIRGKQMAASLGLAPQAIPPQTTDAGQASGVKMLSDKKVTRLTQLVKKNMNLSSSDAKVVAQYAQGVFKNGSAFVALGEIKHLLSTDGKEKEGGLYIDASGEQTEVSFRAKKALASGLDSTVYKTETFSLHSLKSRVLRNKGPAMKSVYKVANSAEGAKDMMNEKEILDRLHRESDSKTSLALADPIMVKMFSSERGTSSVCIQREYANQDANEQINKTGFSATQTKKGIADLALTLEYCHSKGVVHCDIKLKNTFVDKDNNMVLGDFGLGIDCRNQETVMGLMNERVDLYTPRYSCPNDLSTKIKDQSYFEKRDSFSFGMMAYELVLGTNSSLEGNDRVGPFLSSVDPENLPEASRKSPQVNGTQDWSAFDAQIEADGYPLEVGKFIKELLNPDINARPTMTEALVKYGDAIRQLLPDE
ncbi:hypothetical protein SCG7086_BD_00010 [Chlamydiales bacterium SCGC AG-110-P3]|nr:hypothetical protein SCG7086_BD_00010 [Chlamydiales bacterium SCGC AG-110-P3]